MAIGTDIDPAGTAVARKRGPGTSLFAKAWRTADFKIGFAIVLGLLILSVIGPYLLNLSPTQFNVSKKFLEPGLLDGANMPYLFGTDQLGRDLFSRSLIGLRNALFIGVVSVIGMFIVGSAIGMIAGYVGGWVGLVLMRLTDAQMSIPVVILAITILGVTRPTPLTIILVFILAGWPAYARVARSVTLSERRREYVRAAKILGASDLRILLVHIAPNILPPIAFVAVLDVAKMMIFEAAARLHRHRRAAADAHLRHDHRRWHEIPHERLVDHHRARPAAGPLAVRHQFHGWCTGTFAQQDSAGGRMNTSSKILDVQGLSVDLLLGSGARRPVLRDVSLSIEENRVLGIIGESGSGKTVLSRALINWVARPLEITGGKILYRGEDLVTLPQRQMQALRGRKIAYIGSDPGSALDPTIPIGHQIVEKLKAVEPGISNADAARRVVRTLDAVRIPSAAQRFQEFPFQFSGGMMQRVMIVDALVTQPDLLVADNITQPLDVTVAAQILRLLKDLQRDFNTAILFVSSSLGTLHDIADEVLVLSAGQVVEHQPFEDLLSAPKHPYTANLISDLPKIWETDTRNTGASIADKISDSEVVLSVRDISRVYSTKDPTKLFGKQHVHAVRGVSFDVHKGDSLGIVGRIRLRQVLALAAAQPARIAQYRADPVQGQGYRAAQCQGPARPAQALPASAAGPVQRHPAAFHHRPDDRRTFEDPRHGGQRDPPEGRAGHAGNRPVARSARQAAGGSQCRPAPAREHRARHGARSGTADPRRDAVGARPGGADEASGALREIAARARHHAPLHFA
jgi:peptide/nickel transport system permease protein